MHCPHQPLQPLSLRWAIAHYLRLLSYFCLLSSGFHSYPFMDQLESKDEQLSADFPDWDRTCVCWFTASPATTTTKGLFLGDSKNHVKYMILRTFKASIFWQINGSFFESCYFFLSASCTYCKVIWIKPWFASIISFTVLYSIFSPIQNQKLPHQLTVRMGLLVCNFLGGEQTEALAEDEQFMDVCLKSDMQGLFIYFIFFLCVVLMSRKVTFVK